MVFIDYYKILGIAKTSTSIDVKNAYRKLARKYHPDLNPDNIDANNNFQEINEANAVLSDPDKRRKYDQYGKNWQLAEEFEKANHYQGQSSGTGRGMNSKSYNGTDYSEFFKSIFGEAAGTGRSRQTQFRGQDFNVALELGLADAFITHKQTLNINGENIRVTVPAGIKNGQTIKITGHGGPGINGGPDGDLYITFSIANHPEFKRKEDNLFTSVDLDLYTAVLGGEITIKTLNGKVKLKVKAETQNGSKIKLKGKGFPLYKKEGKFGDLIVTYVIKIPAHLTDKQKELFTELSGNYR